MNNNVEISAGGRQFLVAVNKSESEAAAEAAELLQRTIDSITKQKLGMGSAANELILAGMKLADELLELKKRQEKNTKFLKDSGQESRFNKDALKSLQKSAIKAEAVADKLEEMLKVDGREDKEAL